MRLSREQDTASRRAPAEYRIGAATRGPLPKRLHVHVAVRSSDSRSIVAHAPSSPSSSATLARRGEERPGSGRVGLPRCGGAGEPGDDDERALCDDTYAPGAARLAGDADEEGVRTAGIVLACGGRSRSAVWTRSHGQDQHISARRAARVAWPRARHQIAFCSHDHVRDSQVSAPSIPSAIPFCPSQHMPRSLPTHHCHGAAADILRCRSVPKRLQLLTAGQRYGRPTRACVRPLRISVAPQGGPPGGMRSVDAPATKNDEPAPARQHAGRRARPVTSEYAESSVISRLVVCTLRLRARRRLRHLRGGQCRARCACGQAACRRRRGSCRVQVQMQPAACILRPSLLRFKLCGARPRAAE